MSYQEKYLKYKNKYLVLCDTIKQNEKLCFTRRVNEKKNKYIELKKQSGSGKPYEDAFIQQEYDMVNKLIQDYGIIVREALITLIKNDTSNSNI